MEKTIDTRKKRGALWCLTKITFIALLIIVMFTGYIFYSGSTAKSQLIAENPPPGTLVDMGGYNMHINCIGQGSPTVIMEAGAGDFSVTWSKIQSKIGKYNRVCTYDRAGFGWSDVNPNISLTSHSTVNELDKLLKNSGIDDTYILVGHSLGGIHVRLFADLFPEKVAGIVLVDSLYENQPEEVRKIYQEAHKHMLSEYSTVSMLQSIGLLALSPQEIPAQGLPNDALHQYRAILATRPHIESMIKELRFLDDTLELVRQAKVSNLGSIPLIVLSAEHSRIPYLTDVDNQTLSQAWDDMQLQLVLQSSNSQHVKINNSGHYIQLDQPQLVVDAIKKVIKIGQ